MSKHRWTSDTPLVRHDTGEVIERGEEFDATRHELRCWGDLIDAGSDFTATRAELVVWGSRSRGSPPSREAVTASDAESESDARGGDETADESETDTQAALVEMGYRDLQRVAAHIGGVRGNQKMADLRAELYDHPDSTGVRAAVSEVRNRAPE